MRVCVCVVFIDDAPLKRRFAADAIMASSGRGGPKTVLPR